MNRGSSDQVRAIAKEKYVKPALDSGKTRFAVAVKDLWEDLVALGFPPANVPQVCTALRKKEFLRENGLEIEGIDGPPSKQSTTVVVRYRVSGIESRAQSMERASGGRPRTRSHSMRRMREAGREAPSPPLRCVHSSYTRRTCRQGRRGSAQSPREKGRRR